VHPDAKINFMITKYINIKKLPITPISNEEKKTAKVIKESQQHDLATTNDNTHTSLVL
jgi:antitoxin component of RelBE/YafQ-DinJ toxin-antitoxin module